MVKDVDEFHDSPLWPEYAIISTKIFSLWALNEAQQINFVITPKLATKNDNSLRDVEVVKMLYILLLLKEIFGRCNLQLAIAIATKSLLQEKFGAYKFLYCTYTPSALVIIVIS